MLFDYGDTLVRFHRPEDALHDAYQRIADRIAGLGFSRPDPAVLLCAVHDRVEAAYEAHRRSGAEREIDLVAEAAAAYEDLGIRLGPEELDALLRTEQEAWWQGIAVDPDAVPVLSALRTGGIRVGLCSNAPYRVRSLHDQLDHVGLRGHLDSITFSGAVGWRKPSPRIFAQAAQQLGVAVAACVMVGDSIADDIDGAHAAGMRAILFRRSGPAEPATAEAVVTRLTGVLAVLGADAHL